MKAERFKQQKHKLADAFKAAVIADTPKEASTVQSVGWLIPLLLIGTMLPFQVAGVFFSFTSTLISITFLILIRQRKDHISTSAKTLTAALTLTSILSGCGPALFTENLGAIKIDRGYGLISMARDSGAGK